MATDLASVVLFKSHAMTQLFKYAFTSILLVGFLLSQAQEDRIYPVTDEMPALPGCEDAGTSASYERRQCTREKLDQIISANLKYPSEAIDAKAEGVALIGFVVMKDGSLESLEILEDPGYGMGDAALKAVKKSSKQWIPGKDKGTAVNVQMRVPVPFVLPDSDSEQSAKPAPEMPEYFTVVDQMPHLIGCDSVSADQAQKCTHELIALYLRDAVQYPDSAKTAGIEGTVMTSFIIDETGHITNVEVVEGLGGGCDEEAIRVVESIGSWSPGILDDKAVKVKMDLPVRFRLPKDE